MWSASSRCQFSKSLKRCCLLSMFLCLILFSCLYQQLESFSVDIMESDILYCSTKLCLLCISSFFDFVFEVPIWLDECNYLLDIWEFVDTSFSTSRTKIVFSLNWVGCFLCCIEQSTQNVYPNLCDLFLTGVKISRRAECLVLSSMINFFPLF